MNVNVYVYVYGDKGSPRAGISKLGNRNLQVKPVLLKCASSLQARGIILFSLAADLARQERVKRRGEAAPVRAAERRRAAPSDHSLFAQIHHEIAVGKSRPDGVLGIQITAGIYGDGAFLNNRSRQGHIRRDYNITGRGRLHDIVIGHVEAFFHTNCSNEGRSGDLQGRIGRKDDANSQARRGSEHDLFDGPGTGVRVYPDVHTRHFIIGFLRCSWGSGLP